MLQEPAMKMWKNEVVTCSSLNLIKFNYTVDKFQLCRCFLQLGFCSFDGFNVLGQTLGVETDALMLTHQEHNDITKEAQKISTKKGVYT